MDAIVLCVLTFLPTTRFLFLTHRGLVHQGDLASLCCQGTHPLLLEGKAPATKFSLLLCLQEEHNNIK